MTSFIKSSMGAAALALALFLPVGQPAAHAEEGGHAAYAVVCNYSGFASNAAASDFAHKLYAADNDVVAFAVNGTLVTVDWRTRAKPVRYKGHIYHPSY